MPVRGGDGKQQVLKSARKKSTIMESRVLAIHLRYGVKDLDHGFRTYFSLESVILCPNFLLKRHKYKRINALTLWYASWPPVSLI